MSFYISHLQGIPGKLEHRFRRISTGILTPLPSGHEDINVPTFRLLLQVLKEVGFFFEGVEKSSRGGKDER